MKSSLTWKAKILAMSMIALTAVNAFAQAGKFKIAVMCPTVSQNEEENRVLERIKAKYPGVFVSAMFPDNFVKEQETTMSNIINLVSDPDVKALVCLQDVAGVAASISKARELRPEIMYLTCVIAEDPNVIGPQVDIALNPDQIGMGEAIIKQSIALGAKTFVHYSLPRHMSMQLLSSRRDRMRKAAESRGLKFVDATSPDPLGDSGVAGTQQFILEDVPKMIAKYGKDTAFFGTNPAMMEPLIKKVAQGHGIFPQPCDPSPYQGFPSAFGITIPKDKAGDSQYVLGEIKKSIAKLGNAGRMSTWPVSANMMMCEASLEYARQYCEGTIKSKSDMSVMKDLCSKIAGSNVSMIKLVDGGKTYNNFFTLLSDYYTF
jgi:hypothetical protein